jgi:hypothetical protein
MDGWRSSWRSYSIGQNDPQPRVNSLKPLRPKPVNVNEVCERTLRELDTEGDCQVLKAGRIPRRHERHQ